PERLEEVALVVVHGEDEDLGGRHLPLDLVGGLKPGHARHRHVQDGDVGLFRDHLLECFDAVLRLCHDLHVGLAVEEQPDARADDSVIVGDQDPHVFASGAASCKRGSATSLGTESLTVVPLPGRESISRLPCTSSARSRMPERPRPLRSWSKANPPPSSATSSMTSESTRSRLTSMRLAPEWRAAFARASCATR